MQVTDRSLASDREIRSALKQHMPNLDWRFQRPPPGEWGGAWRSFKATREGIEYSVNILSWWRDGAEKIPEYTFFVDGTCVLVTKGVDHRRFAAQCSMAIKKLAKRIRDRANKLDDALMCKDHRDGYAWE